jgi:hypothetical protein
VLSGSGIDFVGFAGFFTGERTVPHFTLKRNDFRESDHENGKETYSI